ncbi:MAG: ABC transporter substrate-binding protein [Anaerolineales bacterium]
MKRTATLLIYLLLVFSLTLSGCAKTDSPAGGAPSLGNGSPSQASLTPIRLPMGYIPDIQFAPFYVADAKGFFRDEGLEVTFDYSFETDGMALVGSGEIPFTLASGEQVLLARAQGLPAVYVAAWYQQYPIAVVTRAESGIAQPADLKGHTIGLPGLFGATYVGLRALLAQAGLSEADVTLQAIGFNQVEAFASGQQDVVVGYLNNEPVQLAAQGFDLTVFRVADYVSLASNGLVTNEQTIAENPDLVRRMVKAVLRGLNYTLTYPDEAYEISKGYVETLAQADEGVQREVLQVSMDAWRADPLGRIDPAAWENMQQVLLDMGMLSEPLDLSQAYTDSFLP